MTIENAIEIVKANTAKIVNTAKITSGAQYESAMAMLRTIALLRKEIASSYDPIIRKQHEAHREAIAQKQKHTAPLDEADATIRRAVGAYLNEQKKVTEQLEISEADIMSLLPQQQESTPQIKGVIEREVWSFEITSPESVPREYLAINADKIGTTVRRLKGLTNIPGVKVVCNSAVTVRKK